METRVVRLNDKALGAPFFASEMTLRRTGRYRARDFFDLVAVVGGEGWHVSYSDARDPQPQRLSAGDLVLYRPGDDLEVSGAQADGMSIKYVSFPAAEWQTFLSMLGLDPTPMSAPDPPMMRFDLQDEGVLRPFDTAIGQFRAEPTSLDLVRFWIDIIPAIFPSLQRQLPGAGAPRWLSEAVEAMREEDNLRGGVPRMLTLAHVSPAHLAVTVRRYFDKTPTELVRQLRLRNAALLLSTTSDSVSEIATRCGFGSLAYFSTAFRRHHHVTPREYRRRALGRFGPELAAPQPRS